MSDTTPAIIDLSRTTPTLLPAALRDARDQAFLLAEDGAIDDNPFVQQEWRAVGEELDHCARMMEHHFDFVFRGNRAAEHGLGRPHAYRYSRGHDGDPLMGGVIGFVSGFALGAALARL